jgi:hypothetical protein
MVFSTPGEKTIMGNLVSQTSNPELLLPDGHPYPLTQTEERVQR